jgi:hypothetical protein
MKEIDSHIYRYLHSFIQKAQLVLVAVKICAELCSSCGVCDALWESMLCYNFDQHLWEKSGFADDVILGVDVDKTC